MRRKLTTWLVAVSIVGFGAPRGAWAMNPMGNKEKTVESHAMEPGIPDSGAQEVAHNAVLMNTLGAAARQPQDAQGQTQPPAASPSGNGPGGSRIVRLPPPAGAAGAVPSGPLIAAHIPPGEPTLVELIDLDGDGVPDTSVSTYSPPGWPEVVVSVGLAPHPPVVSVGITTLSAEVLTHTVFTSSDGTTICNISMRIDPVNPTSPTGFDPPVYMYYDGDGQPLPHRGGGAPGPERGEVPDPFRH